LSDYQQIINVNEVINKPHDYTAQEAVAQGKRLQIDKNHKSFLSSERSCDQGPADQTMKQLYLRWKMLNLHSFAIV
jgi:hypothetical protein